MSLAAATRRLERLESFVATTYGVLLLTARDETETPAEILARHEAAGHDGRKCNCTPSPLIICTEQNPRPPEDGMHEAQA